MITCPGCGGNSTVVDSRRSLGTIRRRRKCEHCGHTWRTYEIGTAEFQKLRKLQAAARKSANSMRGFDVPPELLEEYRVLRKTKRLSAREAGRILGLIDEGKAR